MPIAKIVVIVGIVATATGGGILLHMLVEETISVKVLGFTRLEHDRMKLYDSTLIVLM